MAQVWDKDTFGKVILSLHFPDSTLSLADGKYLNPPLDQSRGDVGKRVLVPKVSGPNLVTYL